MVVVGSPAATIFINNCNKLITIIRIEATLPMCFKNHNSQTNSKVKTCKKCIDDCKECIDKKTLDSISDWIVFFYVVLIAIPVSAVFIFNAFNKTNNSIECKVYCSTDCSICSFVCSFVDYVGINFNAYIFVFAIVYAFILFACIGYIYSHYFNPQKTKCKEIYDDLEFNRNFMVCSAVFVVACLIVSSFFYSNYVTKITVSLALLLVTCVLGFLVKSYNSKYALTKIDIDYMSTTNKYSKIGEHERESKLLVKRKSYLKYYKVMETNYLMMSALFLFITSVLGINSIISLKSASMLFVLSIAM